MPTTLSVDDTNVADQSRPDILFPLLVAAPCGAFIAWTLCGLILNAWSAWSRDLVDVTAGANWMTGGIGAIFAAALVWFSGNRDLPRGSCGAAIGSLAAVGLALSITFFGAAVVSGVIAQAAFM